MSWFRLYDEVVDDPKVQMLPFSLFRAWINLLCIAKKHNGVLPETREVAYRLRVTETRADAIVSELIDAGLFEKRNGYIYPHNWDARQFQSDVSTDRVKRFRERQRNVSETASETDQNRTEQKQIRTDTETEQKPPISPPQKPEPLAAVAAGVCETKYPEDFEKFWKDSTRRGSKLEAFREWKKLKPSMELIGLIAAGMLAWQQSEQWRDETKQPHICRWLKRRGWEEIVPKSNGNGNGVEPYNSPENKDRRNRETAERLLARIARAQVGDGGSGGIERSHNGNLSRIPEPFES